MAAETVPVAATAVFKRVNRMLEAEGMVLRKSRRNSRQARTMGLFYVIDLNSSTIAARDLELEQFARSRGCLAAWERVVNG